jgi:N-methylhydantoinase A/oxoprolinase/acetone carboxylase beta subunit
VAAAEPEAIAVCLLHSYRHPDHERAIGEALRERLGVHVSLSHEVGRHLPRVRARGHDRGRRALSPLLARYLRRLLDTSRDAGLPTPGDHAVERRPGRAGRAADTPR